MDAFDQTLQKAKEIFDVACQKTGEAVSLQKQKLDLSALQNKLTKAYAKLGELTYERNKNTEPETIAEKAALCEIKHLIGEMAKLKEEIGRAKGERVCLSCGCRVPKESKFCNACGADLEQTDTAKAKQE